jgi:RNA recognition motif-containing protein
MAAPIPTQPAAPAADRGSCTVYVGDLDQRVAEPQLVELFSPFGPILSARVIRDSVTRASRGYGYVNLQNQADVEKAVKALNCAELNGRRIRLEPFVWRQSDPSSHHSESGNQADVEKAVKALLKRRRIRLEPFVWRLSDPSSHNSESGKLYDLLGDIDHRGVHELFKSPGSIASFKVIKGLDSGTSRQYDIVHIVLVGQASAGGGVDMQHQYSHRTKRGRPSHRDSLREGP